MNPKLKMAVICFLAALSLLLLSAAITEAGVIAPKVIHSVGIVSDVNCIGPCCCGTVYKVYQGWYYERFSYCRWFKPLKNGDRVTTTMALAFRRP